MRIFLIPLSIALSNPKILGFLFFNEKWPTWEVKREKFSSEILGNLLDELRKLCMNGAVI